jgi:hypothetical protein
VGAQRQFVHNPESVQRLPELALLAGSILSFLAASFPPTLGPCAEAHPRALPPTVDGPAISQRCPPFRAISQKGVRDRPVAQRYPGAQAKNGYCGCHLADLYTKKRICGKVQIYREHFPVFGFVQISGN